MKRILFALTLFALVSPPLARGQEVSFDFFYNNLSGGSWIEVGDYGYCWQPDAVVSNSNWRPYSDGYWAYTDLGWTWVSYEDFGWATYHYGRWAMISDYGWVWVPGRDADLEWGPAWVSWRTGDQYVGWAPLPPETITVVEGRPLTGHIDVEFNIGPAYYNFVDVRYIGEPVLRERIIAPTQNITYIQQTVNVTNITYKNKTVYNYGPDINVINTRASRPIQRLRLDRQQTTDVAAAAKSGGLTKVQGDRLVVAAPARITRLASQLAPPTVKAKVDKAKLDRGWSGVGDEKAQAEFKEKIRAQDRKNVSTAAQAGAAGQGNVNAGASPAAGADVSAQTGKGKKERRAERAAAAAGAASPAGGAAATQTASPAGTAGGSEATGADRGRGRHRNRPGEPVQQNGATGQSAETAAGAGAGSPSDTGADQGRGRKGRRAEQSQNAPAASPATGAETTSPSGADASQGGGKQNRAHRFERNDLGQGQSATTGEGADQGRRGRRAERQEGAGTAGQPAGAVQGQGAAAAEGATAAGQPNEGHGQGQGRRGRQQGAEGAGQPAGSAGGNAQGAKGESQGKGKEGKKAKGEASPVPSPQ